MIEIITEPVEMLPLNERRYQTEVKNNKWWVVDTQDGSIRYKGKYENVVIACHNLNKKFYKEHPELVPDKNKLGEDVD